MKHRQIILTPKFVLQLTLRHQLHVGRCAAMLVHKRTVSGPLVAVQLVLQPLATHARTFERQSVARCFHAVTAHCPFAGLQLAQPVEAVRPTFADRTGDHTVGRTNVANGLRENPSAAKGAGNADIAQMLRICSGTKSALLELNISIYLCIFVRYSHPGVVELMSRSCNDRPKGCQH